MYPNGHHIIGFVKYRWKQKKVVIATCLGIEPPALSRRKPPNIDPVICYNRLFDVNVVGSPAFGDDRDDILDMLISYLKREKCHQGAEFIETKLKQGAKYEKILIGLLVRTNEPSSACYAALVYALHHTNAPKTKINIGQGLVGKPGTLGCGDCTSGHEMFVPGCPPTAIEVIEFLERG
jgi:hypothetical protein